MLQAIIQNYRLNYTLDPLQHVKFKDTETYNAQSNCDYKLAKKIEKKYSKFLCGEPFIPGMFGMFSVNMGHPSLFILDKNKFRSLSEYYRTLFHECTHLESFNLGYSQRNSYAEEELLAEYTAYRITQLNNWDNKSSGLYLAYWYNNAHIKVNAGWHNEPKKISLAKIEIMSNVVLRNVMKGIK